MLTVATRLSTMGAAEISCIGFVGRDAFVERKDLVAPRPRLRRRNGEGGAVADAVALHCSLIGATAVTP